MRKNFGKWLLFWGLTILIFSVPLFLWLKLPFLIDAHEMAHCLGAKLAGYECFRLESEAQFSPNPFVERKPFMVLLVSGMPLFIEFALFLTLFFIIRPLQFFKSYLPREALNFLMSLVSMDSFVNFLLMLRGVGNDFFNMLFRSHVLDKFLTVVFCVAFLTVFIQFLADQDAFRRKALLL